ncbi:hypothetical protein GW17_00019732 [Ensete ventricosum]|nr:hypothetical protein GW17_00019732 [Ensete ventricosum]
MVQVGIRKVEGTTFAKISTGKPSVSDGWTTCTIEFGQRPTLSTGKSPIPWSATHSQAAAKATQGQHAREVGAANRGSNLKGWPLRALQAGARKGLPPPASPTASRGGGAGRRGVRY